MNQAEESYKRKWFDVNVRSELDSMRPLLRKVQVNIPFRMLCESYLSIFTTCGMNPEVGIDAVALEDYDLSAFDEIGSELRKAGLSVTLHAPFMDLSPGSTDPAVRALTRQRFEQTLRVMEVLKPKTVVCHAGYDLKRYGFIEDILNFDKNELHQDGVYNSDEIKQIFGSLGIDSFKLNEKGCRFPLPRSTSISRPIR